MSIVSVLKQQPSECEEDYIKRIIHILVSTPGVDHHDAVRRALWQTLRTQATAGNDLWCKFSIPFVISHIRADLPSGVVTTLLTALAHQSVTTLQFMCRHTTFIRQVIELFFLDIAVLQTRTIGNKEQQRFSDDIHDDDVMKYVALHTLGTVMERCDDNALVLAILNSFHVELSIAIQSLSTVTSEHLLLCGEGNTPLCIDWAYQLGKVFVRHLHNLHSQKSDSSNNGIQCFCTTTHSLCPFRMRYKNMIGEDLSADLYQEQHNELVCVDKDNEMYIIEDPLNNQQILAAPTYALQCQQVQLEKCIFWILFDLSLTTFSTLQTMCGVYRRNWEILHSVCELINNLIVISETLPTSLLNRTKQHQTQHNNLDTTHGYIIEDNHDYCIVNRLEQEYWNIIKVFYKPQIIKFLCSPSLSGDNNYYTFLDIAAEKDPELQLNHSVLKALLICQSNSKQFASSNAPYFLSILRYIVTALQDMVLAASLQNNDGCFAVGCDNASTFNYNNDDTGDNNDNNYNNSSFYQHERNIKMHNRIHICVDIVESIRILIFYTISVISMGDDRLFDDHMQYLQPTRVLKEKYGHHNSNNNNNNNSNIDNNTTIIADDAKNNSMASNLNNNKTKNYKDNSLEDYDKIKIHVSNHIWNFSGNGNDDHKDDDDDYYYNYDDDDDDYDYESDEDCDDNSDDDYENDQGNDSNNNNIHDEYALSKYDPHYGEDPFEDDLYALLPHIKLASSKPIRGVSASQHCATDLGMFLCSTIPTTSYNHNNCNSTNNKQNDQHNYTTTTTTLASVLICALKLTINNNTINSNNHNGTIHGDDYYSTLVLRNFILDTIISLFVLPVQKKTIQTTPNTPPVSMIQPEQPIQLEYSNFLQYQDELQLDWLITTLCKDTADKKQDQHCYCNINTENEINYIQTKILDYELHITRKIEMVLEYCTRNIDDINCQ